VTARRFRASFQFPCSILFLGLFLALGSIAAAQVPPDAVLEEASRRTGLSKDELRRLYREGQLPAGTEDPAATADGLAADGTAGQPGRTDLQGIDDSRPGSPQVLLPFDLERQAGADLEVGLEPLSEAPPPAEFFGSDFFQLDPGVFNPTTFGPVPDDYLIGVGDQIVVDVWGEVELRLERIVDRDGTIILPQAGKITCYNRTLGAVEQAIRSKLAESYSGISRTPGAGTIFLDVSLGSLRAIRVFVIARRRFPGSTFTATCLRASGKVTSSCGRGTPSSSRPAARPPGSPGRCDAPCGSS